MIRQRTGPRQTLLCFNNLANRIETPSYIQEQPNRFFATASVQVHGQSLNNTLLSTPSCTDFLVPI